jgi:putative two-component system response regulator
LHDVGKLLLPVEILLKPSSLLAQEWELVKTHSRWSATIAAGIPAVHPRAIAGILHHHERWDGTGYPSNLHSEQIPIESRILAVCDVYDTLVSKRAYGREWSTQNALSEIQQQRSLHFDPKVVDAFLERALGRLA